LTEVRGIRIICSKPVSFEERSPSSPCSFIVNFARARALPAWPPNNVDEEAHSKMSFKKSHFASARFAILGNHPYPKARA